MKKLRKRTFTGWMGRPFRCRPRWIADKLHVDIFRRKGRDDDWGHPPHKVKVTIEETP